MDSRYLFEAMQINEDVSDDYIERIEYAVDKVLFDVDLDYFHLLPYTKIKEIEDKLERTFARKSLDLSYKSAYLPRYGIKIGGNRGGMASDVCRGLQKKAWKQVEIEDLADIDITAVYKNDKFGFPVKGTAADLRAVNNWSHVGYGSQASMIQRNTDFYVDKYNNVLVDSYALTWD